MYSSHYRSSLHKNLFRLVQFLNSETFSDHKAMNSCTQKLDLDIS
jgi:hypothetical protein